MWIGMELGFAGVFATNLVAVLGTKGTLMGHGPLIAMGNSAAQQIQSLQIFLMMAMLMALPIAAMQSASRRAADMVARYGGEEFTILLPATEEKDALALAEKVRLAVLNQRITHSRSASGFLTVSIGCRTVLPDSTTDPSTLLQCADAALYEAKRKGRNRVEPYPPA